MGDVQADRERAHFETTKQAKAKKRKQISRLMEVRQSQLKRARAREKENRKRPFHSKTISGITWRTKLRARARTKAKAKVASPAKLKAMAKQ